MHTYSSNNAKLSPPANTMRTSPAEADVPINAQNENKDKPGEIQFTCYYFITSEDAVLKCFPVEFHPHWRSVSLKRKKVEAGAPRAPGVRAEGGAGEGGGADVGCLLFKARFSPDTSVLFINSFSRAVKNQCALHCKQFIMMGGWKKKGKKSSTATELICLSTITQRCSEEEAGAPRQSLTGSMKPQAVIDELLLECKSQAHRHVI